MPWEAQMTARKKATTGKQVTKKLKLNKETLRDLDPKRGAGDAKGGRKAAGKTVGNDWACTETCGNCW
jgi:hypothetical protein